MSPSWTRRAVLALAGVTLCACTTLTPQEQRAVDEEQCRSYGFARNTNAFAECLQRIDLSRQADRRQMMRQMNEPMVVYRPVYIWR